jgi:pilus assembly protein CpaB
MVLAGALGVLLTLSILRSADDTRPVVVAAHDLATGAVLSDANLRVARIRADDSVLGTLFVTDRLATLRGRVVTSGVKAGSLLVRSSVRAVDSHASARVMSFPIARARAVGGALSAGDRVDVVAVDRESHQASYVLSDAEIVSVDGRVGGALSGGSDDLTVTLVVEPATAPQLAAAIEGGTVTLVRSTGAPDLQGLVAPSSGGGG